MGKKMIIAVPLLCLCLIHCLSVQDQIIGTWTVTFVLFTSGLVGIVIAICMYDSAGPLILWLLGFTPAGITPRSTGARLMAWVYTYGVGHNILSVMQSVGTGGLPGITAVAIMFFVGWLAGVLLGLLMIIVFPLH